MTAATRSRLALRANGVVALLACAAAAALLAVVLAWWGWRAFGPSPVLTVAAGPQDPARALAASGLFAAPAGTTPAAADAPSRAAATDLRLLGVLAEDGGRGRALFRLPSGPKLVAVGQAVADGTTLVAVDRDGVTLRDGAGERRMTLRAPTASASAKAAAPPGSNRAACAPPAGFQGDTLRLNAELAGGIVAQPEAWTALAAPERGALVVRDDSGFSVMLAMKKGDRIEQANGIALRQPEDIVAAVLKPLTAGQAVRLVGTRGGVRREWLLLNAGSCP